MSHKVLSKKTEMQKEANSLSNSVTLVLHVFSSGDPDVVWEGPKLGRKGEH